MNAANELLTFIENSPSMFHSIETIKGMLDEAGFTYLPESARWDVKQGGDYYTIRNHSSIIAFRVGEKLTRCVPPTVIHRLTRSRVCRS